MTQDADSRTPYLGMYINPALERRVAFQSACRDLFGSLQLEPSMATAVPVLARQRIDLMILDLERFDHKTDLLALGELLRSRGGAATLVLCPFASAVWLPDLLAVAPFQYLITPAADGELRHMVRQALHQVDEAPGQDLIQFNLLAKEKELRDLLVIQRSLQRALSDAEDPAKVAQHVCRSLCSFPGVRHSSLLHMVGDDLQLLAQESRNHLDLERLLHGASRLQESPLRGVFPGLMAAIGGELVLLDSPEKAGDAGLAAQLADKEVRMVLAIPLKRDGYGAVHGAMCMMFDRGIQFSREQFVCFFSLAQLVSFGLAMGEMKLRNETLLRQLAQAAGGAATVASSTAPALTAEAGLAARDAASQLQVQECLSREIGRARRYDVPLAVIGFDIDIDRDTRTTAAPVEPGLVLKEVVEATQARLRVADSLVRVHEDEFLIIAPHTAMADAMIIAQKVLAVAAARTENGGAGVSVSFGVAQLGANETGVDIMERVGVALSRARQAGRNCVELAEQ
jgi:diguanylate cyclase (GGDEF)-like protein